MNIVNFYDQKTTSSDRYYINNVVDYTRLQGKK